MDRLRFAAGAILALIFVLAPYTATIAAAADAGREAEWKKALEGAKEEGRVVVYSGSGGGGHTYEHVFAEFQKRYPEIKVVSVVGLARQVGQRIMAERRAEKYLADLFIDGATTGHGTLHKGKAFDPLGEALILPEVLDVRRWWEGKHHFIDAEGSYYLAFNGYIQPYFAHNTNLVKPGEIRSYWDLLDPRWKGKMVMLDPTSGGGVSTPLRFFYHHPALGPEFLRRLLSEMDITPSRDLRQIGDWLAVGKFAISLFTSPGRTGFDIAQKQGLPVAGFGPKDFKEGVILSGGNGHVGLMNRAPHPYAARVALNWLLSREGQITDQRVRAGSSDSLRIDIPKDDVPLKIRRSAGVKYFATDRPEWADMKPIIELVNEAWKKKQ